MLQHIPVFPSLTYKQHKYGLKLLMMKTVRFVNWQELENV